MFDIVFVILHYNTLDNTEECVKSIRNRLSGKNYHVVIVDNASPNNSYVELKKLYDDFKDITLLKTNANVGFAKGNNLGFLYAKNVLRSKFIVLMNNDIKITQNDFIEKVTIAFEKEHFDVMGPMILSADGKYTSNPVRLKLITKQEVDGIIHHYKKELVYSNLHIIWAQDLFHWIKNKLRKKVRENKDTIDYLISHTNVELHGCFLVFSPSYILDYNGLDDRTFMYEEERILFKHMMDDGRKMLYNPEIIVYHKEGATTSEVNKNNMERKRFLWRHSLDSAYILRSLFENDKAE